MAEGVEEYVEAEALPAETLTDREMLFEIHGFMRDIKNMVADTAPMLDKLGKSSMGKMLGLR